MVGREGAGEGEEEENLKGASAAKVILYLCVSSAPKSFVLNSKYTVYEEPFRLLELSFPACSFTKGLFCHAPPPLSMKVACQKVRQARAHAPNRSQFLPRGTEQICQAPEEG